MGKHEKKERTPFGPGGNIGDRMAMPIQKAKNSTATIKRIIRYLGVFKIQLFLVLLFLLLSSLLSIIGTRYIGLAIDNHIDLPVVDFNGLFKTCLFLLSAYVLSAFFMWLQSVLMLDIAQKSVQSMRKDLFDKLQKLPLRFFDTNSHGELMSRVTNDIDNVSQALSSSLTQVASSGITLIGTIIAMLTISPILTATTLVIIPVMFFITKKITTKSRKYFSSQQKMLGELNGIVEEVISGQKVVKVFTREEQEINKFKEINSDLKSAGIRAQISSGLIMPIINALNNISFALIAAVGAVLVILKMSTTGDIASFITYARQFTRPLNELANMITTIQSAIAGAERVFEIIDEQPELEDSNDACTLSDVKGEVIFEDVDFSYEKGVPILKNINLYANPGQTIALVGPTGAGKTTIINLLTRFYDIDSGKITIDGFDIKKIKRDSLRSSLGIVLQDTYLFSGTIKDNLKYAKPDATDDEIKRASKLANAHEFVRRLPNGYDTYLAEDASNLSQGQRQMIAIARAILADPAILILDEATSNVDTRTEVKIQEAMHNLMHGRTSFVIAHRLSTIRNADLITVIDNGEIVEKGNHEHLLAKKGFYYNLLNTP